MIGEQEFALTKSLKPDTDKTKTVIVGIQNFEPGTPVQVKIHDVISIYVSLFFRFNLWYILKVIYAFVGRGGVEYLTFDILLPIIIFFTLKLLFESDLYITFFNYCNLFMSMTWNIYFLFEKQAFNGLLKVFEIQRNFL